MHAVPQIVPHCPDSCDPSQHVIVDATTNAHASRRPYLGRRRRSRTRRTLCGAQLYFMPTSRDCSQPMIPVSRQLGIMTNEELTLGMRIGTLSTTIKLPFNAVCHMCATLSASRLAASDTTHLFSSQLFFPSLNASKFVTLLLRCEATSNGGSTPPPSSHQGNIGPGTLHSRSAVRPLHDMTGPTVGLWPTDSETG